MRSAESPGLDAIPQVLSHSDENHPLPRLRDAEEHCINPLVDTPPVILTLIQGGANDDYQRAVGHKHS